jgi:hypothetical protein
VNYLDQNRVTFTLDRWGYGGPTSDPVKIEAGKPQILEVSLGSFFPSAERPMDVSAERWAEESQTLTISLNKHTVLRAKTSTYPSDPKSIAVGRNPIGASSCVAEFSGTILGSTRADRR